MKYRLLAVIFALLVTLFISNSDSAAEGSSDIQEPTVESAPEVESDLSSLSNDWYTYTAKDGSYTVKFPGEPLEESSNRVTYGDQILAYMTQINDFSETAGFEEIQIEDIFAAIRSSLAKNNRIEKEAEISQNGHSGIELTLRREDGLALKMRIFFDMNGRKLYQAIVGSPAGNLSLPEAEAFLNSFKIAR